MPRDPARASLTRRLLAPAVVAAAAALLALIWLGTWQAERAEHDQAVLRAQADVTNHALTFGYQVERQLLAMDQSLRILEQEWEHDPVRFDLQSWHRRLVLLDKNALQAFIAGADGVIADSTRPGMTGLSVADRPYFTAQSGLAADSQSLYIAPTAIGRTTGRWVMNMSRRLDHPDGSFAGVVVATFDPGALAHMFREAELGPGGAIILFGRDGLVRTMTGEGALPPGSSIRGTALSDAVDRSLEDQPGGQPGGQPAEQTGSGVFTGPALADGIRRIVGFRAVPDRDVVVAVAVDEAAVMAGSRSWAASATGFAAGTTLFLLLVTAGLVRAVATARQREVRLARDRAVLARANAQLEQARAAAAARSAQSAATLASMSDGVLVLDAAFRVADWNANFAVFTGVPEAVVLAGATMESLLRAQAQAGEFGALDAAGIEADVAERMARLRAGAWTGSIERTRPNGRTIELRPRRLDDGGYVTLYSDITARKQSETALARSREAAEAANQEKSRFVAMVSHEIRAPLSTLVASLDQLAEPDVPPEARALAHTARQSGEALLGLVGDILDLSSIEAGRLTLRPGAFAPRPLLTGVAEMFRARAAAAGIGLAVDVDLEVPDLLFADAGRLRQVAINLVGNAVKFSQRGMVTIRADLDGPQDARRLRIAVRDPGPAIPACDRHRLFQPFSQLDVRAGDGSMGTGLGLSICARLVGLMGGEIGCGGEATDGEAANGEAIGNVFWLTLPLVAATGVVHAAAHRGGAPMPPLRILLVDDTPASRQLTASALRRHGHTVAQAGSGAEAVALAGRSVFDVALLDLVMPGMSGFEAARRLRALPGVHGAARLIALTAGAGAADRQRCLAAGMVAVLDKPLDHAALRAALTDPATGEIAGATASGDSLADSLGDPADKLVPETTLDAARLDSLRDGLSPAVLASLADDCVAELRQRGIGLRAALVARDASEIGAVSHAMSGVAGSYGMAALDGRLRRIMAAARRGDLAGADAAAGQLEFVIDEAAAALRTAVRLPAA